MWQFEPLNGQAFGQSGRYVVKKNPQSFTLVYASGVTGEGSVLIVNARGGLKDANSDTEKAAVRAFLSRIAQGAQAVP